MWQFCHTIPSKVATNLDSSMNAAMDLRSSAVECPSCHPDDLPRISKKMPVNPLVAKTVNPGLAEPKPPDIEVKPIETEMLDIACTRRIVELEGGGALGGGNGNVLAIFGPGRSGAANGLDSSPPHQAGLRPELRYCGLRAATGRRQPLMSLKRIFCLDAWIMATIFRAA